MKIQPGHVVPHMARPVAPRTEVRQGKGPERRGGATSQANMLDMADDASGLLAALRSRRTGAADAETTGSGLPWLDHILADDGAARVADLRTALYDTADTVVLARMAREILPDMSDLAAAVRVLMGEAGEDAIRRKRLQALLAELELQFGQETPDAARQLRAGLNVAVQARTHARKLKTSRTSLRASYRHFLSADLDPTLLYELWIEQYGFDRRLGVLTFIEQALATDIYSLDPSCARREFGNLLGYARRLTVLRSADSHLMACPWQATLCRKTGLEPAQWVKAVFSTLREGPEQSGELRELMEGARTVLAAGEKAALLISLRRTLQWLPHQMWHDAAAQLNTLSALDQWIGAATRAEQPGITRLNADLA